MITQTAADNDSSSPGVGCGLQSIPTTVFIHSLVTNGATRVLTNDVATNTSSLQSLNPHSFAGLSVIQAVNPIARTSGVALIFKTTPYMWTSMLADGNYSCLRTCKRSVILFCLTSNFSTVYVLEDINIESDASYGGRVRWPQEQGLRLGIEPEAEIMRILNYIPCKNTRPCWCLKQLADNFYVCEFPMSKKNVCVLLSSQPCSCHTSMMF
ncbi:hypothetical protein CEXT_382151 [Caerostris extrusa]|uniref:Uncharacterized protein n=1 Tax=Caerostris extrusa TaxID=172846 RepID=A0AAV4VI78_CAEEX|nr:hypothetical protein CEXT_382151 [Caerostris extrusa]